jgi:TRAP-type transport system periplasmic protein
MKTKTALKVLSVAALVGTFATQASALELKMGHNGKPGSLFEASANEFAKAANAKLGDKAKVTVFGSGQLGKDKEMLKKLKLGTAQIALNSSIMASRVDEFGMFDMPYLVKDRAHMAKIEKEIFWSKLAPAAAKKDLNVIALWENGFRHITNNKNPINVPGDLAGIKLRTPSSKWRVKMFKSYGANPTPLPFGEVFVALQTGTFDGQENPFAQIASARFQEVQKYLSLTYHVYTPGYVVTSTKHWKKVPADVRAIVEAAAKHTQAFVYKKAAELEVSLLDVLKKGGMKVNNADTAAFVKASAPIYKEFGESVKGGADLVAHAMKLAM